MWNVFKEKSEEHKKAAAKMQPKDDAPKKEEKKVKEPAKKASKATQNVKRFEKGHGIFVKPLVSEKSAVLGSDDIYTFVVTEKANKVEIKKAFKALYAVEPTAVRIVNMPARVKRYGRTIGQQSAWKKAYIRVPKGSTISLYEGV